MPEVKYQSYRYEPITRQKTSKIEHYERILIPKYKAGKRKILFVLDFVPTEDLRSGMLLSGETGDLLHNLVDLAKERFLLKECDDFSWVACSFNMYRTLGKSSEYMAEARRLFAERIAYIINDYKPNVVISFGKYSTIPLIQDKMKLSGGKFNNWIGVPIKETVKHEDLEHTCLIVPTLSLNTILTGGSTQSYMIGYIARNIANALNEGLIYKIDAKAASKHKTVLIDSVEKFDDMLDMLAEQKVVAIDTETENLNRVTNKLLTIQFAKCTKYAYILPIYHKDAVFTGKETRYIVDRLREYFEGANGNEYHVYANAQFDLNIIRTTTQARYMHNKAWCIFAGEFSLDENMKILKSFTGEWYYSLGNLSTQYGFDGYYGSTFTKDDRVTIKDRSLDKDLLRYMGYDVIVPLMIHEQQKIRAADQKHTKYESIVCEQHSDLVHIISRMETNGSGLDVDYLFHLKAPKSPIEAVIQELTDELFSSKSVIKANKKILKEEGIPSKGLFGANSSFVFSLQKEHHKQILFFDILKLKPVKTGKKGQGLLNKKFQSKYEEKCNEVKLFIAIQKAKKLRNSYVTSFIKLLGSDTDIQHDHRIRPQYGYLQVISGRIAAERPNLQQIPSRSELGKHIKRLFIARPGCLYVKVDYRVHEVRGWAILSLDKVLADVFIKAKELRERYRRYPSPELAKRVKTEADPHVINAAFFFGVLVEKVTKELRNSVKGVVFGLIYQMSLRSLAVTLGKDEEYAEKLVNKFFKRFPRGMKWIEKTKQIARKFLFYENPMGLRRNLWGYLIPKSSESYSRIHAEMDRKSVNSPIQGFGAQLGIVGLRVLDTEIFKLYKKTKRLLEIYICNSVHDSAENEVGYKDFMKSIGLIEYSLTEGASKVLKERHNMEPLCDFEIDFEIGASLATCQAWDFSVEALEKILYEELTFQKEELKRKLDINDTLELIFRQTKDMPQWMREQIENNESLHRFKKYVSPFREKSRKKLK